MKSRTKSLACLLALMIASLPLLSMQASGASSAPTPPTDVTTSVVNGQVVISWNPPVDTGGSYCTYLVYRAPHSGDFSHSVSVQYDTQQTAYGNSYVDTTAQPGQYYLYSVVAVNSYGQSEHSDIVWARAPASQSSIPSGHNPSADNGQASSFKLFPVIVAVVIGTVLLLAWDRMKKKRSGSVPSSETKSSSYCRYCGSDISADATDCQKCGKKLD